MSPVDPVTGPDPAPASAPIPVRRLLVAAGVAIVLAAIAFVVMVRTRAGQRLGDESMLGRLGAAPSLRDGAADVLRTIDRTSIVVMGGAIVITALVRRRPRLALVTGAWMTVAVAGAEVMKRVIPRPENGFDPPGFTHNTAPSGHTTIAMALVFGAIMVAPRHHRLFVTLVGAVYATAVASGVLAAGWHRPVDPVIASLWVFSLAVLATAGLVRWRGDGIDAPDRSSLVDSRLRWAAIVVVALVPFVILFGSLLVSDGRVEWTNLTVRFVVATVVIDVVVLAVLGVHHWLVRDLDLDVPRGDRRRRTNRSK